MYITTIPNRKNNSQSDPTICYSVVNSLDLHAFYFMEHIDSIFLIDDDKAFNLIHTKLIQSSGYDKKITSFTDGNQALSAIGRAILTETGGFPDIIFLDIHMPKMGGWEFVERLERLILPQSRTCKVFMLSSIIDEQEVKRAETYELVRGMIKKPFTQTKLRQMFAAMKMPEMFVLP